MNIKECYEIMDANYEDVHDRLINDELILRFNKKFLSSKDYYDMLKFLEEENYPEAFRMAHNIKGLCLNLSYSGLYTVINELCEALRHGKPNMDITPMLEVVAEKYKQVIDGIAMMK